MNISFGSSFAVVILLVDVRIIARYKKSYLPLGRGDKKFKRSFFRNFEVQSMDYLNRMKQHILVLHMQGWKINQRISSSWVTPNFILSEYFRKRKSKHGNYDTDVKDSGFYICENQ